MNSTTTNSSSTVEIQAVTTKNDSSLPRPAPACPDPIGDLSGTRSGASREGRCQHRFANGKRCRNSASQSHFGLCLHHFTVSAAVGASRQQSQSDSVDLSAELLGELSEFESASEINKFLAKLLVQVTKGRVSPRRASVLAYITNQLLHSHRAINYENHFQSDESGEDIAAAILRNVPLPIRDEPPKVS
jgi:hypothetical protein